MQYIRTRIAIARTTFVIAALFVVEETVTTFSSSIYDEKGAVIANIIFMDGTQSYTFGVTGYCHVRHNCYS